MGEKSISKIAENGTFCPLPWYSLTGQKSGKIGVCCMNNLNREGSELGNIKTDKFSELWNSEKIRELRLNMLNGKKSKYCEECYFSESKGLFSVRERSIRHYKEMLEDFANNTDLSGYYSGKLRLINIGFSNLCNLACRMCCGDASSKRILLDKKLGMNDTNYPHEPYDVENFWGDIANIDGLDELHLVGGEPFINKNFYKTLRLLVSSGLSSKIILRIITNLTVLPGVNGNTHFLNGNDKSIFEILDKFKCVNIWVSVDGYQKSYEKIRIGGSWDVLEKNLDYTYKLALKNSKYSVGIFPTIQIDNIYDFPKLYIYSKIRKLYIDIKPLLKPEYLSISHLPVQEKKKITVFYVKVIEKYKLIFPEIEEDFNIIIDFMNNNMADPVQYKLYLKNSKIMDDFSAQVPRLK